MVVRYFLNIFVINLSRIVQPLFKERINYVVTKVHTLRVGSFFVKKNKVTNLKTASSSDAI